MRRQNGQATVEMLGVVPALLAVGLVLWQLILVGHTAWVSGHAARAAARAALVGDDALGAAKSALPGRLEKGVEIESEPGGATRVRVPVPILHHGWRAPIKIAARASLEAIQ